MPTTIKDLVAAVQATNNVIKDPQAGKKDLEAAAEHEHEHETVTAYLEECHQGAQMEAQAQAEAG